MRTFSVHVPQHRPAPAAGPEDLTAVEVAKQSPTPAARPAIDHFETSGAVEPLPATCPSGALRRARALGGNLKRLVTGLRDRERRLVDQTVSVVRGLGVAARHAMTLDDLKQLRDFAELALADGKPLEVFGPVLDVASYVVKYPEEARQLLRSLEQISADTWKTPSPWMKGAAAPFLVADPSSAPPRSADVAVIGGGLSAGAVLRQFAKAFSEGTATPQRVLVLEKDRKEAREHAASLRNAGIICTAMDYVFAIDEAIGDAPVARIRQALGVSEPEAQAAYASLMQVMRDATARIRTLLAEAGADAELRPAGSLDVARTKDDLQAFRSAAQSARAAGLDWQVLDAALLEGEFGIRSDAIVGALHFRDSAQLHPGKLVKALFEHALAQSDQLEVCYGTEVTSAERDPSGQGWILHTSEGEVRAREVIDAREAFAPYRWRQARYSQIHVVDVGPQGAPMRLGDTSVCHSLSYMRKLEDGKFLVGSGDFPLHDPASPPRPLASIALYAASQFKKLYPDVPLQLERVWGGVFGRSEDDLPVAGELLKGWHVIGGAGGSGLNFCPALAEQTVNGILGAGGTQPLEPADLFSPRRFFLKELRHDLQRALGSVPGLGPLPLDELRVEVVPELERGWTARREGGGWVFAVDEATLDAMNPDEAAILGGDPTQEIRRREGHKARWVRAQVDELAQGRFRRLEQVGARVSPSGSVASSRIAAEGSRLRAV
jgi:glycine/D-amino acid oxidase-like deaminating enzyme